jgi:hypothetical protein
MLSLQDFLIYLIIVIVILLLIKFFFCDEYFTEVSGPGSKLDNLIGIEKKINLIVHLNGKKYCLIPVKKSFCGITENNPKDCNSTILILKEMTEYEEEMKVAKAQFENEEKVCNIANKLDCETKLKTNNVTSEMTSEEISKNCADVYDICKKKLYHPANFSFLKVDHFIKDSTKPLYKIISSIQEKNIVSLGSISTNEPKTTLELVCFEGTIEGNNYFSSVELEEVLSQNDNQTDPSFRIKFLLPDRFDNGMELTENGKPVYKSYYIGACAGDKELKCSTSGKDYFRLCLYTSVENPNVLKFTPKLVS